MNNNKKYKNEAIYIITMVSFIIIVIFIFICFLLNKAINSINNWSKSFEPVNSEDLVNIDEEYANKKITNYIYKNYGNTITNIKLLRSEPDTYTIWNTALTKKIKGSYVYVYSAYSTEYDFTFYIYYNDNNGEDIFKDSFEIFKQIKKRAQEEIDFIKNNIKENIISTNYSYPEDYNGPTSVTVNINIDADLDDVINEDFINSIMELCHENNSRNNKEYNEELSKRVFIKMVLNYKNGRYIEFGTYYAYVQDESERLEIHKYFEKLKN